MSNPHASRSNDRPGTGFERVRGWFRSDPKRAARTILPNARRRIAIWAVAIAVVLGAIELFMPVEDSYRAIRAAARSHPADGQAVVVYIDDRSLDELGINDPRRSDDAKLIDHLFASGARRVLFDRAFADASDRPGDDEALIAALKRHGGKVLIGASRKNDQQGTVLVPQRKFAEVARVVAINGREGPFGLSTLFPTSTEISGVQLSSLSATLAGVDRREEWYRVDFAIDFRTIPTASYIDVLRGRTDPALFRGRDVVIAPSGRTSSDLHPIPFNRKIPGALLHVMGAETLRNGYPIEGGWIPPLAAIGLLVAFQARRRRPSRRLNAAAFAGLALLPFALDQLEIAIEIMPAALCLTIAAVRLSRLARETHRGSTELQTVAVLQHGGVNGQVDVIALKIRNFANISALLAPDQVNELLAKAQAMLRSTDESAEFAFEKDTFVWLASRLRHGDLEDHLRGLHALFNTSISVGAQAPDVASSIGVDTDYTATLRERTENAIQCAEDAAHSGRIYMVAEPRMVEDRVWRLQILSELESAIRNEDVHVFFQPKFSLASGTIIGAEALIRWNHPTRGTIEPSHVIAIAEEHNRVDMITRFVLNRAINHARRAIAIDPQFKIAVNISALDLRDPMFVSQVEHLLAAYRFPASNLVLEVTETAPIENDAVIANAFAELKRMGVKLSVDDFGIGHASLHYLRRIPADEVKIDRSFVTLMDSSIEDRALVRTSIEMIHSLGRTAVAEGVENESVVELLRQMGCDAAQGYFFAKAMPMEELLPRMGERTIAA